MPRKPRLRWKVRKPKNCGRELENGSFFHERDVYKRQDYISMTPEELRRRVAMVPQTVNLFTGTLAENLRIAAPDATDDQLLEALGQVRLLDWVLAQPEKLETPVGDACLLYTSRCV